MLREFTPEQVSTFRDDDVLEGEALSNARRFEQATGGTFFEA